MDPTPRTATVSLLLGVVAALAGLAAAVCVYEGAPAIDIDLVVAALLLGLAAFHFSRSLGARGE